ncbi:MAG: 3-isopropylmalate dehydratase small subunit [Erythrobacter sp.]
MSAFPQPLIGIAAPLMIDNLDTDTIIPSREMRSTGRTGLAGGLFAPLRYLDADNRTENPDFVLNRPDYREAKILLGGENFGCGSSREHAVWALAEWGIRAVIASSFAPIFKGNCIRNFILPVVLPRELIVGLAGETVAIDLGTQKLFARDTSYPFSVDPEARSMLLQGLDAIDLTLTQREAIDNWIAADTAARPWIYLEHAK